MSIIINNVEIFPYIEYKSEKSFFPVCKIPRDVENFFNNLNETDLSTIEYEYKYYIYKKLDFNSLSKDYQIYSIQNDCKYQVKHNIEHEIKDMYDKFMLDVQEIQKQVGKAVNIIDLPITQKLFDFTKPYCRFSAPNKLILSIEIENSREEITTVQDIAYIYVSRNDRSDITKICEKCGHLI